jgi:hypothetical protein
MKGRKDRTAEGPSMYSMYRLMSAGLAVFLSVPGCAWMKPAATSTTPGASEAVQPAPVAPKTEADSSVGGGSDQRSPAEKPPQAAPPPPARAAPASSSPKAKSSSDTRPVKQAGAPPPSALAAPASSNPPTPTLDLASLEQRLRDTRAIGVFTKLSLKNQVDDLLGEFRALYQGPNKHPTAELRKKYDELLLKVLSLLQNGDPPLATAIASSREAIWSILADPEKFTKI